MNKNKFTIVGIIITTLVLAGVAIFTALRLYETRQTAVAPNVPSSRPNAQVAPTKPPANACSLSFSLVVQTATPTATATTTATATATAVPKCNSTCSSSADCPSGLTCYKPNGATAGNCRNASCTTASNCFCSTSTPTATATSNATVTPTATTNPQCNYSCTSNSGCPSSMICYIPSGQTAGNCRNTQCLTETDCLCPNPTATATSTPSLPVVGTSWPTVLGTGLGILVILGSLLLAL